MAKMNKEPLTIKEIIDEGKNIKTFLFDRKLNTIPGKFIRLWITENGEDFGEKPFALSYDDPLGVTIRRIEKDSNPKTGRFTNKAFEMEVGGVMYGSGPQGRGFPTQRLNNRYVIFVGGGIGIPPLGLVSQKINAKKVSFLGAKTVDQMIMVDRFDGETHVSTDDGSYGMMGTNVDSLENYNLKPIINERTKAVLCGPEKMMSSAASILEEYMNPKDIYVSVERLMKCGIGLCGSCDFGGYRVCVDGPVFKYSEIKGVPPFRSGVPDFGVFKRDRSGRKEMF